MALIQGLIAALLRSAGKILNTAFGWATILLFGRVPPERQVYLSASAFGSVIWLVALAGVASPSIGAWLLGLVTLPPWVDQTWVRLGMFADVVVVPLMVGTLSIFMKDPAERPRGSSAVKTVLKGYPYTFGLGLTLVTLTVLAPVWKLRSIARRWIDRHVPIIVKPEDYVPVVGDLQRALRKGGISLTPRPASSVLRIPTRILAFFAGGGVSHLVADNLTVLAGRDLEVLLHPSDLVISGQQAQAAHAQAMLAKHLTFTRAYLTWTKEANEFEDRLRALWERVQSNGVAAAAALARLEAIEREIDRAQLEYEEWEVLFRQKLLVEAVLRDDLLGNLGRAPEVVRPVTRLLAGLAGLEGVRGRLLYVTEALRDHVRNFDRSLPAA